jgi:Leu/Phe-tRNA-protein transferase
MCEDIGSTGFVRLLRPDQLSTFNYRGLRFLPYGYVFISPKDNPDTVMDRIVALGYQEESCFAVDFSPDFIARLMAAGFLIMSRRVRISMEDTSVYYIAEPVHHLHRAVLFFDDLHEKKSARKKLLRGQNAYELHVDEDFDRIIGKCIAVHGSDWVTPPLVKVLREIRAGNKALAHPSVRPVTFGLYRDGELKAGEFGIVVGGENGGIYTSYSGYHEEDDAGNVQLILTGRYLRDAGFAFWDLGMVLPYKTQLGARDLSLSQFLSLWRQSRPI